MGEGDQGRGDQAGLGRPMGYLVDASPTGSDTRAEISFDGWRLNDV
jgi:hypothetical protein